jgi:hypothetical protein
MADYAMLAEVVKALIVASRFLETDLEKLRAAVSTVMREGNCLRRLKLCRVTVRIGTTRMPMDVCFQ